MKQLQLKPGVDIDTVALPMKQGVQTIGGYDKRAVSRPSRIRGRS